MFEPKNFDEELILLFYTFARTMRQFANDTDSHELTFVSVQALFAVFHGKSTTGEIADDLQVSFPTATVLIEKLVKVGLIIRSQDHNDKRVTRLQLTEKGKVILKKTKEAKMKRMHAILENVSLEEKIELKKIFSNLLDNLKKGTQDGK